MRPERKHQFMLPWHRLRSALTPILAGPIGSGEIVTHTSLRGAAALCVIGYHASLPFKRDTFPLQSAFFLNSFLFVDLFFILSGFILTRKYAPWFSPRIEGDAVPRFFRLRFARIYPAYLLWFLAALSLSLATRLYFTDKVPLTRDDVISIAMHLTMTQSIFRAPEIWNVPLWSITVEFVAYALFPLLALLLARHGRRVALLGALLALGAIATISISDTIDVIQGPVSVVRGFSTFTIGAAIASCAGKTVPFPTPVLTALQLGMVSTAGVFVATGREIAAILCFAALVWLTLENRGGLFSLARLRLVHSVGVLSYSIYLSHTVLQHMIALVWHDLRGASAGPQEGFLILTVGGAIAAYMAAAISFTFIEIPARRWLRRF